MSDLAALHAQARRLTLSIRGGLDRLEALEAAGGGPHNAALAKEMQQKLADLQSTSLQMESIWRMQVVRENATKRDIWKRKVEQVSEETDHLRMALDKCNTRERRRQVEADERAELLSRRSTGGPLGWQRAGADEETALRGHVSNSKRILEEAYETGTAVLGNMAGQRERLKAAQRKMLDVLNTVGLSNSLLRVIDRRHKMDRWLTYGGMTGMSLLLIGLWWWLKR